MLPTIYQHIKWQAFLLKGEAVGARLIYLSPYSPDFNPIEQWWSKLKTYLRQVKAQTREALEAAICHNIDQVSCKDLRHWFTHCCYFY